MRILLCVREDYDKIIAGDSIQIKNLYKYLRNKGIKVDINRGNIVDFSPYDIIHLFNLISIGSTYKYYKIAQFYKKNVVITPIYWDLKKYYEYENDSENITLWKIAKPYRKEVLKGCKMVYTNSNKESTLIKEEFGGRIKSTVAYEGISVESEEIPLYNFKERNNLDKYVLCVGRICRRKNQVEIARACKEINIDLVLIGQCLNKRYLNECTKYKNVKYLGDADEYNVYNAYKFANVHATSSFVDIPGIGSLKGAAYGCNLLCTSEGSSREYFGEDAFYCNPYKYDEILTSLQKSIEKKKDNKLKNYVLSKFNWENYSNTIYESYCNILY